MPKHGSRRITLADLVFAAVLCGLVVAVAVAPTRDVDPLPVICLFPCVVTCYLLFRRSRGGEICPECGKPFVPVMHRGLLYDCGDCGAPQTNRIRSYRRKSRAFWGMFSLIPVLALLTLILIAASSEGGKPRLALLLAALSFPASGAIAMIAAMVWLVRSRDRMTGTDGQVCEACGVALERPPSHLVCPACLRRKQSLAQASREVRSGSRLLIVLWTAVLLMSLPLGAALARSMARSGGWVGAVVAAAAVLGGSVVLWKFARFLIAAARVKAVSSVDDAIARARRFAGEEGTIARDGSMIVWYSGSLDPTHMLIEEFAQARQRFESLLGATAALEPPPLCLAFHSQDAHARFLATTVLRFGGGEQTSQYFQKPWSMYTFCSGLLPGRITDPRTLIGGLHSVFLAEQAFGAIQTEWYKFGLINALCPRERPDDLIRLNRRMIVAITSGIAWREELFSPSTLRLIVLLMRSRDPKSRRRTHLFAEQSWSIVEYLIGEHAPESRKDAFRDFLQDKASKAGSEDSFFRNFGSGYGTLLESWRQWVENQGIGPDLPPPPRIADAIVNRVLPVIHDATAPRAKRIRALDEWWLAGYILGADSLIELLRDPGSIPKAEIVWALSMASGQLLGDDPDRWREWWEALPRPRDATPDETTARGLEHHD